MPKIEWGNFIQCEPSVLLGKPVVKGTRLAVEFILALEKETEGLLGEIIGGGEI